MNPQTPAEGILKQYESGDSRAYQVVCQCGQSDHTHNVWVEADQCNVTVTVYVDVETKWWSTNRIKQIWTLLTKGYLQCETSVLMSEQQALNYAETLKKAIEDVKYFKEARSSN